MGEKHEKIFNPLPRPPSRPLAAGPSMCHSSLEGEGDRYGIPWGVGGAWVGVGVRPDVGLFGGGVGMSEYAR